MELPCDGNELLNSLFNMDQTGGVAFGDSFSGGFNGGGFQFGNSGPYGGIASTSASGGFGSMHGGGGGDAGSGGFRSYLPNGSGSAGGNGSTSGSGNTGGTGGGSGFSEAMGHGRDRRGTYSRADGGISSGRTDGATVSGRADSSGSSGQRLGGEDKQSRLVVPGTSHTAAGNKHPGLSPSEDRVRGSGKGKAAGGAVVSDSSVGSHAVVSGASGEQRVTGGHGGSSSSRGQLPSSGSLDVSERAGVSLTEISRLTGSRQGLDPNPRVVADGQVASKEDGSANFSNQGNISGFMDAANNLDDDDETGDVYGSPTTTAEAGMTSGPLFSMSGEVGSEGNGSNPPDAVITGQPLVPGGCSRLTVVSSGIEGGDLYSTSVRESTSSIRGVAIGSGGYDTLARTTVMSIEGGVRGDHDYSALVARSFAGFPSAHTVSLASRPGFGLTNTEVGSRQGLVSGEVETQHAHSFEVPINLQDTAPPGLDTVSTTTSGLQWGSVGVGVTYSYEDGRLGLSSCLPAPLPGHMPRSPHFSLPSSMYTSPSTRSDVSTSGSGMTMSLVEPQHKGMSV